MTRGCCSPNSKGIQGGELANWRVRIQHSPIAQVGNRQAVRGEGKTAGTLWERAARPVVCELRPGPGEVEGMDGRGCCARQDKTIETTQHNSVQSSTAPCSPSQLIGYTATPAIPAMSTMPRHVEKGGGHDGGLVRQPGPGLLDKISQRRRGVDGSAVSPEN